MHITFVSGNTEKLPDAVVPIGLLYVMANTPDTHEKQLIDLCFENDPIEALKNSLKESSTDVVAISMRNIQKNDYSGLEDTIEYYERLIQAVRESCDATVVIGGGGFSVMPEGLLQRLKPDFGISGEGEENFPKLLEALENDGKGIEKVGALHYFENGEVVVNKMPPGFLDMTTLRNPERNLADPRYYSEYGVESVQTKRGCPLRCDYCTYPVIEGRVGRTREPAAIVDEMFASIETNPGISHFFFVDSVFNLPRTHAKNVCRELISRNWSIPWTCYINPLGFDLELAQLMKQAGCSGIEVGSDSGVDGVLQRLHKGFTTEHIRKLHDICVRVGIPDCHTFILGTEGETLDDVKHTLKFLEELDPFSAMIMIWIDDYEALDQEYREQRMALRGQIEGIIREEQPRFPTWFVPPLQLNFNERLFRALRRSGLHGPLWQYVRT